MQTGIFSPEDYDALCDFSNKVTLMIRRIDNTLIIRKTVSASTAAIYVRLLGFRHKHLANILHVEVSGTHHYTFEEYTGGQRLDALMDHAFPEETAAKWITQLCDVAEFLHRQNPPIIHRDIKPQNIMISPDGVLKLIDFDAAKQSTGKKPRDTELIGTPGYAAPEQYGFAASDSRTDVYAIGTLFQEMLVGPNGTYKGKYKRVIRKCMELDTRKRYQSAQNLKQDITSRSIFFRIPGLRSRKWWKAIIAFFGYLAIIGMSINAWTLRPPGFSGAMSTIALLLAFMVPTIMFCANIGQIRQRFPLLKSPKPLIKALGVLLYLICHLLLMLVVAAVLSPNVIPDIEFVPPVQQ